MLLFYRFQVLDDGCLLDNDTGAIIRPKEKNGKLYHLVPKGNHSNGYQYFGVDYLLETKGIDNVDVEIQELPDDYVSVANLHIKDGQTLSDAILGDL